MRHQIERLAYRIRNARHPGEPYPRFALRLWKTFRRIRAGASNKILPEDRRAVERLLRSGKTSFGPQNRRLESEFAARYGVHGAAASSSGTAAVHVGLAMVGIEPGDEVIVPPITDMGSILPILAMNAIPIFADVDRETWNLDPDAAEAAITPRTRAIIAVHLFGNPCELDRLRAIADRHGIALIEDCAQAHWAQWDGRPVGTVGDAAAFSLQWSKHLTSCEGGITLTDDPERAVRGRLFVDKGWNRGGGAGARKYPLFGLNLRLSEMQAALGRSQLTRVEEIIARRRESARCVIEALEGAPGLRFQRIHEKGTHAYWQLGICVEPDAPYTADALVHALGRERIAASAHYIGRPIHECHEPLQERRIFGTSDLPFSLSPRGDSLDYSRMPMPVAEDVLERLVMLPEPHQNWTPTQARELGEQIRDVIAGLCDPARMPRKPEATLKAGVVGCGVISRAHLEAWLREPRVRVTAIADPSETARRTLGSAFGVVNRYETHQEMFDAEDLDIVLVAVWPQLHEEVASAAARAGVRAVLCEKPMAPSLGEARRMLDTFREAGSTLVIGHQHRFNPHIELARELVAKGEVGRIVRSHAHCASSLLNNGSHVIDALLYVLGEPKVKEVEGRLRRQPGLENRGLPVEASSVGTVTFEDQSTAVIEMGDDAIQEIGWHLEGERGVIHLGMEEVRVERDGATERHQRVRVESMRDQISELADFLESGAPSHRGEGANGYAALEILVAILEAGETGRPVTFPVTQTAYPLAEKPAAEAAGGAR